MRTRTILFAGALLAAGLAVTGWLQYRAFLVAPLNTEKSGFHLQVTRGASVRSVIEDLEHRGSTQHGWRWRLLTRLHPVTIRAGEYLIKPGLTPTRLLDLLASGEVVRYRFTIIEGWTFRQLQQALAEDPVLLNETRILEPEALYRAIGGDIAHPEGWFLPETYQFVRGDSDLDILRWSHSDMRAELESAWERRRPDLPLNTPYELLILASIVEKESALESERADIAGVFTRRLRKGWRLETDPTVIYGLGESWDGDIRRRDLDTDTPYNTYTRYGLPPTPIAMPGRSAIAATATPAEGDAMFFVADGSGGHVFSDTLDEHNAAVRKLLDKRP